jgi:adenylate kinase
MKTNIIILGPPGSGKGTQSRILQDKSGFVQIIMSDILRNEIKSQSKLGLQIKEVIDSGSLLSNELVCELFKKHMLQHYTGNESFVFDGMPRTLVQAKYLCDFLQQEFNAQVNLVISLQIHEDLLYERIEDRLVCVECSASYRSELIRNCRVCESCSGVLKHRVDDNRSALTNRLSDYRAMHFEIESYYSSSPVKLLYVDAAREVGIVENEIMSHF